MNSDLYNDLLFYTLSHPDPEFFIHQYAVDAFAAQNVDENTKNITLLYAVAGLYLAVERGFSGKEVQNAHLIFSKEKSDMPLIIPPENRGEITIKNVLEAEPGIARDEMILHWCASVWEAYQNNRDSIISYCQKHLG